MIWTFEGKLLELDLHLEEACLGSQPGHLPSFCLMCLVETAAKQLDVEHSSTSASIIKGNVLVGGKKNLHLWEK